MNTIEIIPQRSQITEEPWEELYDKYSAIVLNLSYSIVKDWQLAEDILQETFIKVKLNYKKVENQTGVKIWIMTIARNTAINLYNRRKREIVYDFQENEDHYQYFESYDSIENKEFFKKVLNILDETEREIVLLYVVAGYKHREIASIISKPQSTVKWIYLKALKKLRKHIKDEELY